MKISEMNETERKAIEVAIKAQAEKSGFDPDGAWARYCKAKECEFQMKLSEYMRDIIDEMHRRGWEKPANLDYEAHPVTNYNDRVVDVTDGWCEFLVNYGTSEGIYLDWCWREWDVRKNDYAEIKLPCFKTLDTDLNAAEQMGLLAGRLTWLSRKIYL